MVVKRHFFSNLRRKLENCQKIDQMTGNTELSCGFSDGVVVMVSGEDRGDHWDNMEDSVGGLQLGWREQEMLFLFCLTYMERAGIITAQEDFGCVQQGNI